MIFSGAVEDGALVGGIEYSDRWQMRVGDRVIESDWLYVHIIFSGKKREPGRLHSITSAMMVMLCLRGYVPSYCDPRFH